MISPQNGLGKIPLAAEKVTSMLLQSCLGCLSVAMSLIDLFNASGQLRVQWLSQGFASSLLIRTIKLERKENDCEI